MPRGPEPKISEAEFVRLFEEHGATEVARRTNTSLRWTQTRRALIEGRLKRKITSPNVHRGTPRHYVEYPGRLRADVDNGVVVVASDCHYWPGPPSLMHRALVGFCKELKPKIVVLNGDVIDACSISRHPPIGWEKQPSVQEEIEAGQERLGEIEKAAFRARKIWTLGNHDGRFSTRLATVAREFASVAGTRLKDHFPLWEAGWSLHIHDAVIKHRWKGGIHAPHNNAVQSGVSMITGHLHSAKVTPWTDYTGTRYGVDTGCIAHPYGPQFEYLEDSPRNWVQAFAVLTFRDGKLLWPELVTRHNDEHVLFRGEVTKP